MYLGHTVIAVSFYQLGTIFTMTLLDLSGGITAHLRQGRQRRRPRPWWWRPGPWSACSGVGSWPGPGSHHPSAGAGPAAGSPAKTIRSKGMLNEGPRYSQIISEHRELIKEENKEKFTIPVCLFHHFLYCALTFCTQFSLLMPRFLIEDLQF